jgi:choline dehydrogenase-like flavoprotein
MADVEADVVVIGAGPVGAAVSWRLATQGLNVVCVERGDWVRADGLRRNGPDWELRRSRELHANPNIRASPDDDPIDDEDTPIKPMMAYGVGGTSWHWSAHVPRFRPDDFRVHSLDGVADDWPLRYEDLRPYYALNEERWGVASWLSRTSTSASGEGTLELPTIGSHGRRLAAAFDDLGWSWGPVDLVVGRQAGDPQTEHCTHIGLCDLGCPSRMCSLAEQAYLLDALAAGARLMTHTRVLSLEHGAAGHVVAAVAETEQGAVRVRGSYFVLAANGSSTPRLLLLSANGRCPNGLANGSGLVGRNLMLHPYARADGLFPEALGAGCLARKPAWCRSNSTPRTAPEALFAVLSCSSLQPLGRLRSPRAQSLVLHCPGAVVITWPLKNDLIIFAASPFVRRICQSPRTESCCRTESSAGMVYPLRSGFIACPKIHEKS